MKKLNKEMTKRIIMHKNMIIKTISITKESTDIKCPKLYYQEKIFNYLTGKFEIVEVRPDSFDLCELCKGVFPEILYTNLCPCYVFSTKQVLKKAAKALRSAEESLYER
jgi:hypothetical protein